MSDGYSHELYDVIAAFGLQRGAAILDIGGGNGNATGPFIANGFPVTGVDVSTAGEQLPFPDERFAVVVSAQDIAWFERPNGVAEAARVLQPRGILAIWWKQLMDADPVRAMREGIARGLGIALPSDGLQRGFRTFYGSELLAGQTLRVLPWRTAMPLDRFIEAERARSAPLADALERTLRERFGETGAVPLSYIQYLYLAKKR